MPASSTERTVPVIVVGGGWAGLAAALAISEGGHPVMLLEGARRLGGRARAVQVGDHTVDNGQHLLLGSCTAVLEVLGRAGVEESEVFSRRPFGLWMRNLVGERVYFRAPPLPPPLHLAAALVSCRGLSVGTRLRGLWSTHRLLATDPGSLTNRTVAWWLSESRQPAALRMWLWEPLCLAALNTPASEASASSLARLLREVLTGRRTASDLLIPRCNLESLFAEPVARRIRHLGGSVELASPVVRIEASSAGVKAVHTRRRRIACDRVVLATGPSAARTLLISAGDRRAAERIAGLEENPISTVYLQYPERIELGAPYVGLVGMRTQWLFDRGDTGQKGLLAGVISADSSPPDPPFSSLGEQAAEEIAALYPHWPKPTRVWTIRERRATFAATPAAEQHRQPMDTAVEGLSVIGDYTETGLPGTLEGAVRSGLACARSLLALCPSSRERYAGIDTSSPTVS